MAGRRVPRPLQIIDMEPPPLPDQSKLSGRERPGVEPPVFDDDQRLLRPILSVKVRWFVVTRIDVDDDSVNGRRWAHIGTRDSASRLHCTGRWRSMDSRWGRRP